MNIKELLETIKDTSRDYIGVRGYENDILCQDLTREELDLIVNEIERLNNIINDIEKYLWEERYNHSGEYMFTSENKIEDVYTMILDKLKELKEKKNDREI